MKCPLPKKLIAIALSGGLVLNNVPTKVVFAEGDLEVEKVEVKEDVEEEIEVNQQVEANEKGEVKEEVEQKVQENKDDEISKKLIDVSMINSIEISSNEMYTNISENNYVDFTLDIEKPENIMHIRLMYKDSSNNEQYVDITYNEETGLFEGRLNLYSDTEYKLGTQYISYINIIDQQQNGHIFDSAELEKNGFNMEEYNIEIKKYEPVSIKVDKKNIKAGESATIKIDVSNYPTKIDSLDANIANGSSGGGYSIWFEYNESENIYEGTFTPNKFTKGGSWLLNSLNIRTGDYGWNQVTDINKNLFIVENDLDSIVDSIKVSASKNTASPGDEVKITLEGIDYKETDSITVDYENLNKDEDDYSSKNYKDIELHYNKKTQKFEGYLNTSPYDKSGTWIVKQIYIYGLEDSLVIKNKDYNQDYGVIKDLSNLNINIKDTVDDKQGPTIKSVAVDKKTAKPGETINLIIDASDDLSGIDLDSLNIWYSGESVSEISIGNAKYNSTTKKYEVPLILNGFTNNGEYTLRSISLKDKSGNSTYIDSYENSYIDLLNASFTVTGGVDSNSEIISSIDIDNKEPQYGDVVNFSIGLKNSSNISKLELWYYQNTNSSYDERFIELKYNESTKKYEGSITIDEDMKLGKWNISYICGYGSDGNYLGWVNFYEEDGSEQYDLDIISKVGEGLTVDSINIDKSKVTKNQSINLNVKASDKDGEIRKVSVRYIGPNGKTKTLNLNTLTRSFNGSIDIGEFTEPGLWQIESITLEDNERNRSIIYNTKLDSSKDGMDLSNGDFEVYGTKSDNEAPELIDINLDKDRYVKGEEIKVSISAKDIGSGIKSIKANFNNTLLYRGGPFVEFIYNEETGLYEYTIDTNKYYSDIPWDYLDSAWIVDTVIIEDNVGNISQMNYYENSILRSAYFYVSKTEKWHVNEITDKSTSITGVTEENSSVTATINGKKYTAKSDSNGRFSITIPNQVGGTIVNIVVKNSSNAVIQNIKMTVADYDAPEEPIVTTIVDTNTGVVQGKAEANSTVVIEKEVTTSGKTSTVEIGRGKADSNGNFKVTIPTQVVDTKLLVRAIDACGNKSTKLSVIVRKGANKKFVSFAVDSVNNKSTAITGKGVSGAKVEAYVGTTKIGSATVNSSGKFSIGIKARATNAKIKVVITKSGYEKAEKTITVVATSTKRTKTKTNDIYKYDAGKGKYLTYINNKGYSQYSYLNTSGKYAFTPSSWMSAAGLSVSMPTSKNGYTMMIDNNYIEMKSKATALLNNIKNNKVAKADIEKSLSEIEGISTKSSNVASTKAAPTKSLTNDIYKYDAGKGKYLTYINGKGYSQYVYLNKSGKYAFTPSSWMTAAGLTVTMPTAKNGYTMKITNQYKLDYEKIVKEIKNYM